MDIGQLEKASGIPRSTIYYYVREGLLPLARKRAASRAMYSDEHLRLLEEIARLKSEGMPLSEIKDRVAPTVRAVTKANVDASENHAEQMRQSILKAAARHFARKGYKGTRLSDILDEIGITPPVFYDYFPSKQDLFVEAFRLFVDWMGRSVEAKIPEDHDLITDELSRVQSYYFGIKSVGMDMLSLVRSEAERGEGDTQSVARDTFKVIASALLDDLAELRQQKGITLNVADELVAFGVMGAMQTIVMRACWDDKYSAGDVLWAACSILLGLRWIYGGLVDVSDDVAEYGTFIQDLAQGPPLRPLDELL